MTTPESRFPGPGRILLTLARLIFHESARDSAVHPTILDLRQEWHEAGADRRARLLARWRGYRAFWALVLRSPYAFPAPASGMPHAGVPEAVAGTAMALIALAGVAALWLATGPWALLLVAGAVLVAVPVHVWYLRHPSRLRSHTRGHAPEINVSAIHVGGDIGGLIFVIGSVLIVLTGVPGTSWFLLGVLVAGLSVARALVWLRSRPRPDAPGHLTVACR